MILRQFSERENDLTNLLGYNIRNLDLFSYFKLTKNQNFRGQMTFFIIQTLNSQYYLK